MYRLRQMDVDDKVCEQVDMTLLAQVYSSEVIERCVGQSQPWASKARRVRQSTLLALVLLVIGLALWSRLSQQLVWDKLVGKLSRYDVSEVHGAHHLLDELGRDTLLLVDAGITSGGFLEHVRQRGAQVLGALEAGVWEHLPGQRRLADGSVLVWVPPTGPGQVSGAAWPVGAHPFLSGDR